MLFLANLGIQWNPAMQTSCPLTSPIMGTFRVLGLRSNLAGVEVLGHALGSAFEQIRLNALQTLVHRGGAAEMSEILERIDLCNDAELPLLADHVSLLLVPIEAGLADRNPLKRQRSLCAIAKLKIASLFYHLVQAAQTPDDSQQMVAAELIMVLASRLGAEARAKGRANESIREKLLSDLWQSVLQFNDHRIMHIVEAWLCASHWDDEGFKSLFSPAPGETICRIVLRQLRHSHRIQIIELLAGVIWSNAPSTAAVQALGERNERCVALQLAELANRFGITPMAAKNLALKIPIPCMELLDFSDETYSIQNRCALLKLLTATDSSPDNVLRGIIKLLETLDPTVDLACSNALRGLRTLKTEIVVMVLSDCFEMPGMEPYDPPPWKSRLRSALERLIELYPHQSDVVRSSIEFAFSDFRCEELIKHLDDWPESHLNAYAKVVRIAEVAYVDVIERDAKSQSAVKRSRAIHAVRFLGMENGLADVTLDALQDKNEMVRIEAICAVATGRSRSEAIEVLRPLTRDEDQSVITAAKIALSSLES